MGAHGEIEITITADKAQAAIDALASHANKGADRIASHERQVMSQLALERKRFVAEGLANEVAALDQVVAMRKKAYDYKSQGFSQERATGMARQEVLYDTEIAAKQKAAELSRNIETSQASLNAQKLRELEITAKIAAQEHKIGMEVVKRNLVANEMTAKEAMLARLSGQVGHSTYTGMGQTRRGSAFGGGQNAAYRVGMVAQQAQDVAVSLQMGMSMSRVIAQQGSQIASIFGTRGMIAGGILAIGAGLIDIAMRTEAANKAWEAYGETVKKYAANSDEFLKKASDYMDSAQNMRNQRLYGDEAAAEMKAELDHLKEIEKIRSSPGSRIYATQAINAENIRYAEQLALVQKIWSVKESEKDVARKARDEKQNEQQDILDKGNSNDEVMRRLGERFNKLETERGGLGGKEWQENKTEALSVMNRLVEMSASRQKEIDDITARASQTRDSAREKELSGQQKINKLTAEYLSLIVKIGVEQDPIKKAKLQLEAAKITTEAFAAKKQAESEKKEADKNALDARQEADKKKLDKKLSGGKRVIQIAEDIAAGAYTPQGNAAKRAQERSESKLIEKAARQKAMDDYGKDWQKLSGVERQRATMNRFQQAKQVQVADKVLAAIDPQDIKAMVSAIELLLAK